MTRSEIDPDSWSATQRWLDELDRDTTAAYADAEPEQPPTEADLDDRPHDLDDATSPPDAPLADAPLSPPQRNARPAPRFNKAVAVGFAAATATATIAVTTILLGMRADPHTAAETTSPTTQISVLPASPEPMPTDAGGDAPIPYVASASCLPGSTAAQAVAGDDPSRAWVCVRGGVDGQVLTLDLGRTMVVTAVSITPGWVGDASGTDQWPAHRVVTRVQWIFNDDAATVVTQHTGNVHGEAVQAIPHRGVLASKITAIILETARAPADSAPTTTTAAPDGLLDTILGPAPAPPGDMPAPPLPDATAAQPDDPADNTFAVSSVKVLGHAPQ
jgi:hypothetical protein